MLQNLYKEDLDKQHLAKPRPVAFQAYVSLCSSGRWHQLTAETVLLEAPPKWAIGSGDGTPAKSLETCFWLPGLWLHFKAVRSQPLFFRQRGEKPLQVLVARKFLVINPYSFWDVPVIGIVSAEKPGTLQAHYLDTKYPGLSAHIHLRIFLYSVKQPWTCSLVVCDLCFWEGFFLLFFQAVMKMKLGMFKCAINFPCN